MAETPTRGGYQRRFTRNHFLRIARVDFADIKHGHKTQMRTMIRVMDLRATMLRTPCLVVGYCASRLRGEPDLTLLIVEDAWEEPLGTISAESLEAEGFPESLTEFRRYWRARHKSGGWHPLKPVNVWQLRPFVFPDDVASAGTELLYNLYGDFLPPRENVDIPELVA